MFSRWHITVIEIKIFLPSQEICAHGRTNSQNSMNYKKCFKLTLGKKLTRLLLCPTTAGVFFLIL